MHKPPQGAGSAQKPSAPYRLVRQTIVLRTKQHRAGDLGRLVQRTADTACSEGDTSVLYFPFSATVPSWPVSASHWLPSAR